MSNAINDIVEPVIPHEPQRTSESLKPAEKPKTVMRSAAKGDIEDVLKSYFQQYEYKTDVSASSFDPSAHPACKPIDILVYKNGAPFSSFLANLYLVDMDRFFDDNKIIYIRYSDDIIVFADTFEKLCEYKDYIQSSLKEYGLSVNTQKEKITAPHEEWEFLGFSFKDGTVDVSKTAVNKMKGKMKRKARALLRWKKRNGVENERAVRAYIRTFNKKLFDNPVNSEITWTRWYFPIINTDKSLRILDTYMQDSIRFIANGNYSKSRFNLRYSDMKALGYISL